MTEHIVEGVKVDRKKREFRIEGDFSQAVICEVIMPLVATIGDLWKEIDGLRPREED